MSLQVNTVERHRSKRKCVRGSAACVVFSCRCTNTKCGMPSKRMCFQRCAPSVAISLVTDTKYVKRLRSKSKCVAKSVPCVAVPTSPGHDLWKAPHHTEQFHTDDVAGTAGKPTFHAQTRTACRKSAVLSLRECRGSKRQDNRTHTVRAAIPPQTFPTHFRTTASSSSSHQIERSSRCTSRERPTARRGVLRLAPGADDHPVSPRTARAAPLV